MIDHANLSIDALDLADPTAPVSEALLLSSSVEEIELLDPATGDPIGEVAESNTADAESAIKRARAQADDGRWSQMSAEDRHVLINRVVGVIEDRAEALAELATLESGTPVAFSRAVHIEAPLRSLREVNAVPTDHGLDVAIIGVNQPLFFTMQTVAASLAAGRASMIVPSPLAPLTTIALMNCLLEADLPKGVVSAVYGAPDVLKVIRSSDVFSTLIDVSPAGAQAGSTPILQMPGSDVDAALRDAVLAYQNTPGWRTGIAHLLVPADELDQYQSAAADLVDALIVGDPWQPDTEVGPVPGGTAAITRYLDGLTADGAAVEQGSAPDDPEHYTAPSLVTGIQGPRVGANDEICAPVVCMVAYPDVETAQQWISDAYSPFTN